MLPQQEADISLFNLKSLVSHEILRWAYLVKAPEPHLRMTDSDFETLSNLSYAYQRLSSLLQNNYSQSVELEDKQVYYHHPYLLYNKIAHGAYDKPARPQVIPLQLTLAELYLGCSRVLESLTKTVHTCPVCRNAAVPMEACLDCDGSGLLAYFYDRGNDFPAALQGIECRQCNGSGSVPVRDFCAECYSSGRVVRDAKVVCNILPGTPDGYVIAKCFADENTPSDEHQLVYFKVTTKPDPKFRRSGADLHSDLQIRLIDALTGVDVQFRTIDGRTIRLKSMPNLVLKPGQVVCVEGEGMPHLDSPTTKGNLYLTVHLDLSMPRDLTADQFDRFKEFLADCSRYKSNDSTMTDSGDPTTSSNLPVAKANSRDHLRTGISTCNVA